MFTARYGLIFMCNSAYCQSVILSCFYQIHISNFLQSKKPQAPTLPLAIALLLSPNTTTPHQSNVTLNWPFQPTDFHKTPFSLLITSNSQGHFARCFQKAILHVVCFFRYTTARQKTFSEFTPIWKWRKWSLLLRVWRRSHMQLVWMVISAMFTCDSNVSTCQ